jgi:hypothetical protein
MNGMAIGYIEPFEADDSLQDDAETKGRKDRGLRERGGDDMKRTRRTIANLRDHHHT